MYVAVEHTIKDAGAFQMRGQAMIQQTPAGVRPLQFFPDAVGQKAVCLWDGPSVDAVSEYIDGKLGDASDQEYFEVAEEYAIGLPAVAQR